MMSFYGSLKKTLVVSQPGSFVNISPFRCFSGLWTNRLRIKQSTHIHIGFYFLRALKLIRKNKCWKDYDKMCANCSVHFQSIAALSLSLSLPYHCIIIALSLHYHCIIIALYCIIIELSSHYYCIIIALSRHYHCIIIALLLYYHCIIIAISLHNHCIIITLSLHYHCIII